MGSQLVLLELELQRLSGGCWNSQGLEQKRLWGIYVFDEREGLKCITLSRKKGGQKTEL